MVTVATSSDLEVALDLAGGTVTAFLEQLVGEPIDAHERHHEMTQAGNPNRLGVGPGCQLLKRTVVLRGRRSAKRYLYAESLLAPGRLPAAFLRRLENSVDPIGRILTEEGIPFTRVALPRPNRLQASGHGDAPPAPDDCPLVRAYRIDVAGVPVMAISEWFLSTLQSFQSGHPSVDLIRRP